MQRHLRSPYPAPQRRPLSRPRAASASGHAASRPAGRGAAHGRERGVVPRLDNVALGAKVVLAVSEKAVEIVVLALPFLMVDAELRLPVSQLRGAASLFELLATKVCQSNVVVLR